MQRPPRDPPDKSARSGRIGVATRLLYARGSLGGSLRIRTRKGAGNDRTERAVRVSAGRDQPTHQGDLGDAARDGPAAADPFEGGHSPAARQGGPHGAGRDTGTMPGSAAGIFRPPGDADPTTPAPSPPPPGGPGPTPPAPSPCLRPPPLPPARPPGL